VSLLRPPRIARSPIPWYLVLQTSDLGVIAAVASWAEPWRSAVNHSVTLSTGVLFVHLGALVCAGGFSLVADYEALRVAGAGAPMAALGCRRVATRALAVLLASGAALFLSDVAAFADMATFWLKMGFVALLLANARAAVSPGGQLRRKLHARLSVGLWLCTLALGTLLMSG
jgi:hypothetical protein